MPSNFTPKYNLVDPLSPIMNTRVPLFDFTDPPVDPVELAKDMINHMKHYNGIGLSANQLGLPYRCFAMAGEINICFNPEITAYEGEDLMDEGCLSYPGLYFKVKRPANIRVRFDDPYGNRIVKKFGGMTARVFQHEYDHMEGSNYTELVSSFVLQRAKTRQEKLLKKIRRDLKRAKKQVRQA